MQSGIAWLCKRAVKPLGTGAVAGLLTGPVSHLLFFLSAVASSPESQLGSRDISQPPPCSQARPLGGAWERRVCLVEGEGWPSGAPLPTDGDRAHGTAKR